MSVPFQRLIKDIEKINLNDICSSWQWCIGDHQSVILVSSIGDLFLMDDKGAINWLDTSVGQLNKVAINLEEFKQLINQEQTINEWFLATIVEELINQGKILKEHEVYSFKILPALGGEYAAENLKPTDISVHFDFTGQIHQQIKDLPDGTKISNIKFLPDKNADNRC